MPEAPAWRFEKIIKPMFDIPTPHRVLANARLLTCRGDEVIANGFVEIKDGLIESVGHDERAGARAAAETHRLQRQDNNAGLNQLARPSGLGWRA